MKSLLFESQSIFNRDDFCRNLEQVMGDKYQIITSADCIGSGDILVKKDGINAVVFKREKMANGRLKVKCYFFSPDAKWRFMPLIGIFLMPVGIGMLIYYLVNADFKMEAEVFGVLEKYYGVG